MRLQEAAERLWGDTKDTRKADKAAPETKASQEELQHAMAQLSKMMQDLLQRMSLLDQDRQKALEKLLSEMDSEVAMSPREGGGDRGMHKARERIPVLGGRALNLPMPRDDGPCAKAGHVSQMSLRGKSIP
ncbi:uncharacterized protein ACIBXB_004472 [Morphnus guianensis]